MRTLIAPAAALMLFGTTAAANAQRVEMPASGAPGVTWQDAPPASLPAPAPAIAPSRAERWGSPADGRWSGGTRAPGGWAAYRRPMRGRRLPSYWVAPSWYVADWAGYGLPRPPYGYRWSRYYDDAVLIDTYGRILDSVARVDWDRHDMPPPGQSLPPPVVTVSPHGATVVTTSTVGPTSGFYSNGYYYPGPTVTTVTIQSAPKVGAAAAPGYRETVSYKRKPVHRGAHKRKPHRR